MMDDMPLDTEEVEQIESMNRGGNQVDIPPLGKNFDQQTLTKVGSMSKTPALPGLSIGGGTSVGLTLDLTKARDL